MRVLIVSTSERAGGAAVAASRLTDALINNGVKAKMLVRDKQTDKITVCQLPSHAVSKWHFLWERWCIFWHLRFNRQHLFEIDTAQSGTDITSLPEFKEADVIHLHWVNQGMLSLRGIRKILRSGKPVVWTMHDMWPAASICHVTLGCKKYQTSCQRCKLLPGGGSPHDLAAAVWKRKKRVLSGQSISFVACSRWLMGEAKASRLLDAQKVACVPNPIDTRVFRKVSQKEARLAAGLPQGKKIILFVAQRATNPLKGMDYLIEACNKLAGQHPDMKLGTAVAITGGNADELAGRFPFETFPIGYVGDEHKMSLLYNSADVFVLPSLSENLPNTIMEAMACGVPCVGFRVGGIPEMIDHLKNGYVASPRDSDDLAEGLRWVISEADHGELSDAATHKVALNYSQQSVATRYIEVYNEAIAMKRYII